ncbi:MAG TPA: cbb3-type cytochrome c oxidase subunit I [Candidatus Methylacidiphilales bacterium]|nr:cbb3-type cytochrome c oxidase subunit I [Candidatus Methylacidiphilales bacterium]
MATSPTIATQGYSSTDPELAAIDASVRWPVLGCFLTAIHWMVVGTFLLVYASSLAHPQDTFPVLGLFVTLSDNFSMFTYGRLWPAAIDTLVYGWATTAGMGIAIWILARTSRTVVRSPAALMTAVVFWNLGIAAGLIGIFLGDGNSVELLEFPAYAAWTLWLSYALFAFWAVITWLGRRAGHDHIAQAWLLVAIFSFPWLFGGGSVLLGGPPPPGSGVVQALIDAWYVHGLFTLWLAPLGFALLYYLVPKMSGIPIRYGDKAQVAFWTWLIFAPWTAVHDLVGGPFPAETVTTGLVLSGFLFIPVAIIGISLISTTWEAEGKHGSHGGIVFPFLTLSAVCFVITGAAEQILSIRSANDVLRFTMFRECDLFLWLYGFFTFGLFGAIYYIVPRLLDFSWRSAALIRIHYYASLYGILLVIAMAGIGGVTQGFMLENPDPQMTILIVDNTVRNFHIAFTACISLVSIGSGIFALHLGWMLLNCINIRVRANRLASEILGETYEPEGPAGTIHIPPPAAKKKEVAA